jgi:hypothetical protein
MTSFRQIEANRRNAFRSTGPRTEEGKRQSRRNALRHGLTAETVIEGLEDSEDYRAFEAAVIADYDARTAVERELVLRLASLLWRMRRAISIETDLLRIQSEIVHERRAAFGDLPVELEEDLGSKSRFQSCVAGPEQVSESDGDCELSSFGTPTAFCGSGISTMVLLRGSDDTTPGCGSRLRRRCFCSRRSAGLSSEAI